jgi:hypothetical protein
MAKKSNSTAADVEIAEGGNTTPHDVGFSPEQLWEAGIRATAERAQFRSDHENRAMSKFVGIRHDLFMEILTVFEFSDDITEQTTLLLNQLSRDDALAVHCCFEDLVFARSFDVEHRDGDTAEMIERYDAMLAVLVPWLKRNGITHTINERRAS